MFCVKGSKFYRLKFELFTISKNNHLFHAWWELSESTLKKTSASYFRCLANATATLSTTKKLCPDLLSRKTFELNELCRPKKKKSLTKKFRFQSRNTKRFKSP